jgi:hypothetical protein
MDPAARQSERPIGQVVIDRPDDDQPVGSTGRGPEAEGPLAPPVVVAEHGEALSASGGRGDAEGRSAPDRQVTGAGWAGPGRDRAGPAAGGTGNGPRCLHRMVDAIAILENGGEATRPAGGSGTPGF